MNALLAESEAISVDSSSQHADSFCCATPDDAIQEVQRYGFRIGQLGFLFPENCTGEIVIDPEICRIPHTQIWMSGVMMLRGSLIPIFDLHGLFLDMPIELHKPMILILDQGKQALGFVLKDPPQWLMGLIEVPAATVPIPDMVAAQVSKTYRRNGTSWLAFDKTDFFTFLAESAKSC